MQGLVDLLGAVVSSAVWRERAGGLAGRGARSLSLFRPSPPKTLSSQVRLCFWAGKWPPFFPRKPFPGALLDGVQGQK
ncbi:hypothetical protein SEA_ROBINSPARKLES_2 [Gordonia phage RobinSparkles]|nr:hypothetical protein SEA_ROBINSPARKLES_2 [Gordonia phage RobinSparkles]